jgi:hypothetical protein
MTQGATLRPKGPGWRSFFTRAAGENPPAQAIRAHSFAGAFCFAPAQKQPAAAAEFCGQSILLSTKPAETHSIVRDSEQAIFKYGNYNIR